MIIYTYSDVYVPGRRPKFRIKLLYSSFLYFSYCQNERKKKHAHTLRTPNQLKAEQSDYMAAFKIIIHFAEQNRKEQKLIYVGKHVRLHIDEI